MNGKDMSSQKSVKLRQTNARKKLETKILQERSNWSVENKLNFNRRDFRYSSEPLTSDNQRPLSQIIIKIVLTCENRDMLVACKL